jgi:hypothetical protein
VHDDTLVNSDAWVQLKMQGYYGIYGAWAREVLVYPEPYGKFAKGKDIEDAIPDDLGRRWMFPASSIPENAIEKGKIALFVKPQVVECDDERVVILSQPEAITVVTGFMQKDGG